MNRKGNKNAKKRSKQSDLDQPDGGYSLWTAPPMPPNKKIQLDDLTDEQIEDAISGIELKVDEDDDVIRPFKTQISHDVWRRPVGS
ncbi:MAG: hypothetical protein NUW37_12245 [Planctomycetes bacterium]|nr:hypothetical protein [Planctomycetota bacterium]